MRGCEGVRVGRGGERGRGRQSQLVYLLMESEGKKKGVRGRRRQIEYLKG